MRSAVITSLFALAASVSALQLTFPASGSNVTVDLSKENTITWTTVNGDAPKADLLLTNNAVNPPVKKVLKEDIETSSGSYKLAAQTDIKLGATYKFQLVDSNTTGILSESPQFTINKVASEKPSGSPTSSGTGGSTQTQSPAGSSSPPANGAGKVGAWGVGGLLVAAGFAALL